MARRKWTHETIKQVLEGEQPFIQVGYDKAKLKRKNGDEWTDSKGNTWKMEHGAKFKVNKQADLIREMVQPKCSKCGQRIDFSGDKLDHKVFPKTGKCYTCLEVYEFELRVEGKWENYENMKILKYKFGMLKDFREKVLEAIDFLKNDNGIMEDVMSNGDIVRFQGKSNPQWLIDAEKDLIKVNDEIEKMDKEIKTLESTLESQTVTK